MDFGIFTFDFTLLIDFFSRPTLPILVDLFSLGGYLFVVWLLLYAGLHFYEEYRQELNVHHWKWIVLAVDMPALNVQTPKAVEQMFSHLAGALDTANIAEKFYHGHKQRWFSFEIISIGGYIQFLIRTEEQFRDLVEASVYAQYPEAEIVEVEDYVNSIDQHFPNDQVDMWGADFILANNDAYPIRTYREFEHSISKDTVLKDPMGAFLESFSRIGPGEQMWFQMLIEPVGNHWKEKAIDKIKEIIGDTSHGHGHGGNPILDKVSSAPLKLLEGIGDQVFAREAGEHGDSHDKSGPKNEIQYLTPGQKLTVEAMEAKISKIGFKTKIRALYIANKEVFRPSRGVNALIGAISQYNIPTANSLVPGYGVGAHYFFKNSIINHKKNLLMKAYKKRKLKAGSNPYILNIEELATIWHFPMSHVKTPLVQKAIGKQAEPPAGLPVEQFLPPPPPKPKNHGLGSGTDAGGEYPQGITFG